MYRLIIAAVVVATSACAGTTSDGSTDSVAAENPAPPGEPVALRRVLDGDSIEVERYDGSFAEVRLIGINAPEGEECHGDAARNTLGSLLGGSELTLVGDEEDTDQFGRLLRYVFVDGVNANLALVVAGDALALQTGHGLEAEFVAAVDAAAAARLGMWSQSACGPPAPLPAAVIADYVFDPPGRDSERANDEWVQITMESDSTDMSGWILRDESTQNRFVFPPGFGLEMGQSVVVHSGCGSDTANDLYWCARDPIWSNGGDTIVLQLPDGTVIDWERYDGVF